MSKYDLGYFYMLTSMKCHLAGKTDNIHRALLLQNNIKHFNDSLEILELKLTNSSMNSSMKVELGQDIAHALWQNNVDIVKTYDVLTDRAGDI